MAAHLRVIKPSNDFRSVPVRPPNAELRTRRELQRQFPESGYVFTTERGGPFTPDAVNRLVKRIGERAGFPFPGGFWSGAFIAPWDWRHRDHETIVLTPEIIPSTDTIS